MVYPTATVARNTLIVYDIMMARRSKKAGRKAARGELAPSSFVVEAPLAVATAEDRRLGDRMLCGSRLFNVLLQDGIAMVEAMRADPAWAAARTLPRQTELQKKARAQAFASIRDGYDFTKYAFQARAICHKNAAGFASRIGAHETQKIADRVFAALERWLLGLGGKPRFKGRRRPLHSLEGKNNASCLRWDGERGVLTIEAGFELAVAINPLRLAKDEWLWTALQAPTKYCRLVWRMVGGQRRWFVQLIQDGAAPLKASLLARLAAPDTVGGLDVGPSTIAWVTSTEAGLLRFCAEVDRPHAQIRRLQRRIDRQRRANNPDNFHPDGRVKRGCRTWVASGRQQQTEVEVASLHRYEAAVRKQAHGRDINCLLSKGLHWRDDGVSPQMLQRRYGKSIAVRAPGRFMSELARKAASAGGSRTIIEVRALKNSQYDHATATYAKKPLSERWHSFGDGRGRVQRDIYSAFLARNTEGNTYQPARLERAWRVLAPELMRTGWYEPQPARRPRASGASRGVSAPRLSGSCAKSFPKHSGAAKAAASAEV